MFISREWIQIQILQNHVETYIVEEVKYFSTLLETLAGTDKRPISRRKAYVG